MIFNQSLRLRQFFYNPKDENKWNLFEYLVREKRKLLRASLKNFGRQINERVFQRRRFYMKRDPKTSVFWEYMTDERYKDPDGVKYLGEGFECRIVSAGRELEHDLSISSLNAKNYYYNFNLRLQDLNDDDRVKLLSY